jgi:hypothetical protein
MRDTRDMKDKFIVSHVFNVSHVPFVLYVPNVPLSLTKTKLKNVWNMRCGLVWFW